MPDPVALAVDAELDFTVRASSGRRATGRLVGSGDTLQICVDRPEVLAAATHPSDVGRLADLLAAGGIVVRVIGPRGPIADLGAGCGGSFGASMTGSNHVALKPRPAIYLALSTSTARVGLAGMAAIAVLAALGRIWRT